jgi:hypothetical protein
MFYDRPAGTTMCNSIDFHCSEMAARGREKRASEQPELWFGVSGVHQHTHTHFDTYCVNK